MYLVKIHNVYNYRNYHEFGKQECLCACVYMWCVGPEPMGPGRWPRKPRTWGDTGATLRHHDFECLSLKWSCFLTEAECHFGECRDLLISTFASWWRSTSACWTPTFRSSSCFSVWVSVLTSACTLGKGPGSSGPGFPSQGDGPREARPPRPLDSWLFSSASDNGCLNLWQILLQQKRQNKTTRALETSLV